MGNTLPFNYFFFADKLDEMYTAENKLNTLFNIFSLMTIFIACLGLLGLTSYVTEQRSKETSLRKIMGASVDQVVWLLNKDFLILVLISNLISWPVALLPYGPVDTGFCLPDGFRIITVCLGYSSSFYRFTCDNNDNCNDNNKFSFGKGSIC